MPDPKSLPELTKKNEVSLTTILNWEKGTTPQIRGLRERLSQEVEGVGIFLGGLNGY